MFAFDAKFEMVRDKERGFDVEGSTRCRPVPDSAADRAAIENDGARF
jgi:hypothetical protein